MNVRPNNLLRRTLALVAALVAVSAVIGWLWLARTSSAPVADVTHAQSEVAYLGSQRCVSCHVDAGKAWQTSQHALAMQPATPQTMLGTFDGRRLRHGASSTRYFRQDAKFMVASEGVDGKSGEYEITHAFGLFPLQQYLVSLPDGRKQSLGVAWDSRDKAAGGQRWFHLFPGAGTRPGHPQHWAGIDQNWNYQCADCHSTDLRKNYDAATDSFNTRWAEISVGCEACHGPGSVHVQWAEQAPASRKPLANFGLTAQLDERHGAAWVMEATRGSAVRSSPRNSDREIEVCARCHSRRGQLTDEHRAGDPLLDAYRPALLEPELYYADGQQRDEVYNYASFLQSRMYAAGVTCADCHEPHGGKLRAAGNGVCLQCHEAARFDVPAHHHHQSKSAGSACVTCHAPTTTYMGVDPRHDHSFRLPRPDRSASLGTPNACTQCHAKQPVQWAIDAMQRWYPAPKPGYQSFAESFAVADHGAPGAAAELLKVVRDPQQSALARASAIARLAPYLSPKTLPALTDALADRSALVRLAAVDVMAHAEDAVRAHYLAPLLNDARRAVRIETARALAGPAERLLTAEQQGIFARALSEYIAAQQFNADRPEAHGNLGNLHRARDELAAAESEFRAALKRDPTFLPAWVNLADMLRTTGQAGEATALLRQGLQQNPSAAELEHALGLALIRGGDRPQALKLLAAAAKHAPQQVRNAYVYAVAQHDTGDVAGALKTLEAARKQRPYERELLLALSNYRRERGELRAAAEAASVLRQLDPDNVTYQRLAAEIAVNAGTR